MIQREKTKKLTVCAMLAALGVVFLWIGSVIEVADISMAVLASLLCVFAVIEYGGSAPWLVFSVTGVLSCLLLPQKTPAVLYVLLFGYYPILKEKIERLSKPIAWIVKEAVFQVALLLLLFLSHWLMLSAGAQPVVLYVILILLAEIVFPIYDLALTKLISFYVYRLRKRFHIK